MSPPRPYASLADRLYFNTVALDSGCWEWLGKRLKKGYGVLTVREPGRKSPVKKLAHRVSYEIHVGPIPEGYELDHKCGNAWCCAPAHLEPVETQENIRRRDARRRRANKY